MGVMATCPEHLVIGWHSSHVGKLMAQEMPPNNNSTKNGKRNHWFDHLSWLCNQLSGLKKSMCVGGRGGICLIILVNFMYKTKKLIRVDLVAFGGREGWLGPAVGSQSPDNYALSSNLAGPSKGPHCSLPPKTWQSHRENDNNKYSMTKQYERIGVFAMWKWMIST